jgi:type IV pilus assembly protein PilM
MAGGTVVGLDIGSSKMKVAELRKTGSGVEVTALGVADTPPDAYDNSVIIDPQALGQEVKKLLSQSGVTARHVVSSVSGQSAVVVRVIDMPKMTDKELAEQIRWEVERHVPFAVSEVIMDYQPIPTANGDGQTMEVLLAVAQQDMIDRHVAMLMAAGLKPDAIDVEPLAIGRTFLELKPDGMTDGRTVAIVNIGATNTDIEIFRSGLLAFPRSIPLAGDNLTRAIAEVFMCDQATAENYKRDYGEVLLDQLPQTPGDFGGGGGAGFITFDAPAPPEPTSGPLSSPSGRMPFDFSSPGEAPPEQTAPPAEQGFFVPTAPTAPAGNLPATTGATDNLRIQVFNAIAPVLTELVQELRRSLDYFRGKNPDAQIDEMLLTGGTSNLKNLAPFLEAELGIPTRVASPLQYVQVTSKNFTQDRLAEIAALFPISIGLGARDLIAAPSKKKR